MFCILMDFIVCNGGFSDCGILFLNYVMDNGSFIMGFAWFY